MDKNITNIQNDFQVTETTSGHNEPVEDSEIEQPKVKWEIKQETKHRIIRLTQRKNFALRKHS